MNLADRLFDYGDDTPEPRDAKAKPDMIAMLQAAAVPFETIGWDSYDSSLELYGVPADWRMSVALQEALYAEGFAKIYVNHTDFWETHYQKEFVNGWRVSYPHKRPDEKGSIWVEAPVPSWPVDWFKRGYAVVKSWI